METNRTGLWSFFTEPHEKPTEPPGAARKTNRTSWSRTKNQPNLLEPHEKPTEPPGAARRQTKPRGAALSLSHIGWIRKSIFFNFAKCEIITKLKFISQNTEVKFSYPPYTHGYSWSRTWSFTELNRASRASHYSCILCTVVRNFAKIFANMFWHFKQYFQFNQGILYSIFNLIKAF
jgi:hypothetical protein